MTKRETINKARHYFNFQWPDQLISGVMFFLGQRITKFEFEEK